MSSNEIRTFDFRQTVAREFAGRPTLRQVASEQLLQVMLAELPWLADVTPSLATAEPFMLDSPDPDTPYWGTQPLLDRVLQALLDPEPLSIEPLADGRHYNLALTAAYRFAGSHSEFDTRQLTGLSRSLTELVARLPQHFCEAQLQYWRGEGSSGVSRDLWLQLLMKTALLRGLPLQNLDEKEQACIRGLIRGGAEQPSMFLVQATLTSASLHYDELLCHVLVLGEWDERQVVLWCAPSGVVRSFATLAEFGHALRDDLAQRYAFEQMSWRRYAVEGNVFAQQVAALLEVVFHSVDRARYSGLADISDLEQRFAQLSDVSSWFIDYENDTPAMVPPLGLRASAAKDSFAWSAALLHIATDQLDSDGVAALEGVQSLSDYTSKQLAEQIRIDHGDDCSPDNLLLDLYMARGVPGGSATGAGGGEPLAFVGSKTLSEFAIGNLASLRGAIIRKVHRRDGSEAPQWLNAGSARQLVTQVDIGGHYPAYVAKQLDDPGKRADRVRRLGREWRSALLASGVTGKLERKVSDAGLQCVVDFCAGHVDPSAPRMMLFPLAFKRSPTSRKKDRVRGMYVLYCTDPALVLLYRPLFGHDTLREYENLPAMLKHVRESQRLQDSIVDWMAPAVRSIYQNGGFAEPHIAVVGIDFFTPPATPEPAALAIEFWRNNLDERLYTANRDLLVELAEEQSVSNVESRWQTLSEGAWLLFDVVTLVLRGPVASVAWLMQLFTSLENDLQTLQQGDQFSRSAAVVDLVLNMGMALLHARQPVRNAPAILELPDASAFEGPPPQRGAFAEIGVVAVETQPASGRALAAQAGRQLDFAWRGQNGLNWLPQAQRQVLEAMRSNVSLNGVEPSTAEGTAGLYRIGGNYYAALAGDAYRVALLPGGTRVVDKHGAYGAWLVFSEGSWRVDKQLHLDGGSGGMKQSATQVRLANRYRELREAVNMHDQQVKNARARFAEIGTGMLDLQKKLQALIERRASTYAKQVALPEGEESGKLHALIQQFDTRIAQWENEVLTQREASVRQLEEAVSAEKAILPLLATMREPKFASERLRGGWDDILPQHEVTARMNLIRNSDFIINELWSLALYSQLAELQTSIDGQVLIQVPVLYEKFRRRLDTVVGFQDRVLVAHEHLDQLLVDTPEDFTITAQGEEPIRTAGMLIASRRFNTVQLRFHQILNLADLALHLDDVAGQRTLAGYKDDLAGMALRNAAETHGQLDFANLSAQDRIVILQEAWDEYTAALLNSDRIRKEGGRLIEPAMIDRYREHVGKLKLDAGARLVEAIREQDEASAPVRRSPYTMSSAPQQLVRNAQGQLLIGTEIEVDGQRLLQVREAFSNVVLATFEQVEGEWRQREGKRPSLADEATPSDLPMWVQSLLDEGNAVRDKAKSYVENDIKGGLLAKLFDQQLDKLEQAVNIVREAGGNDRLLRALEREVDALRAEKKLQLTMLYTDTNYPTAEALRFMHAEGLITVEYSERRTMQDGSAFDEYRVLRLPSRRNLWAAHFHFRSPDDFAQEFTVGHLKTWSQRRLSSRLAVISGQRLHRGKLTLEQAKGIIPFN